MSSANKSINNLQKNFGHITSMFPKNRLLVNMIKIYLIMNSLGNLEDDPDKIVRFINDKHRKEIILGTCLKNTSRRNKREIRKHLSSRLVGIERSALESLVKKVDKHRNITLRRDEVKHRFVGATGSKRNSSFLVRAQT